MARELIAITLAVAASGAACKNAAPAAAAPTGAPLAAKAFYRIDPGSTAGCAKGATCEARLVLTALGDYHVNKDYPFKFVGEPAPALALDGEPVFAHGDEKHGTMTVKFRPSEPGSAKLVGTFKLSVCSKDTCEIETPKVELAIPVT